MKCSARGKEDDAPRKWYRAVSRGRLPEISNVDLLRRALERTLTEGSRERLQWNSAALPRFADLPSTGRPDIVRMANHSGQDSLGNRERDRREP